MDTTSLITLYLKHMVYSFQGQSQPEINTKFVQFSFLYWNIKHAVTILHYAPLTWIYCWQILADKLSGWMRLLAYHYPQCIPEDVTNLNRFNTNWSMLNKSFLFFLFPMQINVKYWKARTSSLSNICTAQYDSWQCSPGMGIL